ncbi:MAG: ABC transporter substrate-binding protein [Acidobacteriota bacterium]
MKSPIISFCFFILILPVFAFTTGRTLVYLTHVSSYTLDPGKSIDRYSSEVLSNVFEGLVKYRRNSPAVEACLAERWTVKDSGKKWTFYLRKGVKFHNGELFNSEAVVLTFKTRLMRKAEYKTWNCNYSHIADIYKLDDFTVEFILNKPYIPFLYSLANIKSNIIAPSSYAGDGFKPIGTGPFRISELNKGKYLTVRRNENYWGGEIYLSKVIFKDVKNIDWRILQIKNGKADLAIVSSGKEITKIWGTSNIKTLSIPSSTISYLAFNTEKKPFNNSKARRAFAHFFNKQKMIKYILQDVAINATSPLPPHIFGFNPNIKDYDFDINRSRSLLKEAGYRNGFKVSLYYSSDEGNFELIANTLQQAAKKVNIHIVKKPVPFSRLMTIVRRREHDMMLMGWVADSIDPDAFLYSTLTMKKGNLNQSFYNNPEFTGILEKAQKTVNNKEREKLYFRAQEILHRDMPWIPLYNSNNLIIHNKKVKNVYINQSSHLIFKHIFFEEK